jgi:glycosyltransferase involved in cell wall biosynthesis
MRISADVIEIPTPRKDLTDLAVVFPAYNEEANVARAIEAALAMEVGRVVCVDDCSFDRTGEIIESYRDNPTVKPVHHEINQGKQAAVKHGLQTALAHSGLQRFATLDADMQDDPAQLPRVAAPVGTCDMVSTFRSRSEMPMHRRIANALANAPYRFLAGLNIHDVQAGYRVYTRPVAAYLARHLAVRGGYTLEHTTMELFGKLALRWKRPFRIGEVRVPYAYEDDAKSHIGMRDNFQLTRAAARCAWHLARLTRG